MGAVVNPDSSDPGFEISEETQTELDLGKNIVDVAVKAGVQVYVYSGLDKQC